jgi:CheY-like chemotaxis protein
VPAPSKASAAPAEVPLAAPPPVEREARAPEPALHGATDLEAVLEELRAIREGQREILELLRQQPAPSSPAPVGAVVSAFESFDERPAPVPAVRTRRRKTVLVIDDDPQTLQAAVEALERAEVPVRAVSDGNAGLAAIAEEKPDVLVMELGLRGSMGGKDVINMIKATMEWVDVPIVLHTRLPIENQREARQIHGADEYVLKAPDSAAALVTRVIAVFRRG